MMRFLFVAVLVVGAVCWFKSVSNIRKTLAEKKENANEVNSVD